MGKRQTKVLESRFSPLISITALALSLLASSAGWASSSVSSQGPLTSSAKTSVVARSSRQQHLTAYDETLIKVYADAGYRDVNAILRLSLDGEAFGATGPISLWNSMVDYEYKFYRHLLRALDRLPVYGTPGKTTVWRGVRVSDRDTIESRYRNSAVVKERAFTSASSQRDIAVHFASCPTTSSMIQPSCDDPDAEPEKFVLFAIKSRTGVSISEFSGAPQEEEVLFKSGTIFKVEDSFKDEKGRLFISMIELDPKAMSQTDRASLAESDAIRFEQILRDFQASDYVKRTGMTFEKAVAQGKLRYRKWQREGLLKTDELPWEMFDNRY